MYSTILYNIVLYITVHKCTAQNSKVQRSTVLYSTKLSLYSAPCIILDSSDWPLTPMFGNLLPNLLWSFLTLVLEAFFTFLVRYLVALGNLDIGAFLMRNFLALFSVFVVSLALLCICSGTLLLTMWDTHLLMCSITVRFLQSLTVPLILVVNEDILVRGAERTFLHCLLGWYGDSDWFADLLRDVSASFLRDGDTFWNLLSDTLLLWNLDTLVFFHQFTLLLRYLGALLTMMGWFLVCWRFVDWFADLLVLSVT